MEIQILVLIGHLRIPIIKHITNDAMTSGEHISTADKNSSAKKSDLVVLGVLD